MKSLLITTLIAISSVSATALANSEALACVNADKSPVVKVSGTIKKVIFEHPSNGSMLTAYMLQLDKPVCYTQEGLASGEIEVRQDSEIQVVGNTSAIADGAHVELSGALTGNNITAYYLSDTAITIK